jgi:hypothetical protein
LLLLVEPLLQEKLEVRDRADKLPPHFMNHHDVTPSEEQNRVRDRGHNWRSWLVAFP